MKKTAVEIQKKPWIGHGTDDWINELYDAVIDFGAHPNAKSVLPYLSIDDDRNDGHATVSLTSLYGAEAHTTSRCLVACLDYGLVIAVILTSCVSIPSDEALTSIREMNEIKEMLVSEQFK